MEDELHCKFQEDLLSKRLRLTLDIGVHSRLNTSSKLQSTSSHQRNRSLDFKQTGDFPRHSHHRNRSLDSVLQQIPECSSSFHQPLHCQILKAKNASSDTVSFDTPSSSASPSCTLPVRDCIDRTSLASDDSGIFNSDDGERQHQHCVSNCTPNVIIMSESSMVTSDISEDVSCEPSVDEEVAPEGPSESKSKIVMFSKPPPKESLLLRLFESTLFDMSIAITYLFNSKEPGVQTYLGKVTFIIMIKILYSIL